MRADLYPLQVLLVALAGWISRRQQEVVAYLVEENRVLKQQLGKKWLRLTDDQRRRRAAARPARPSSAALLGTGMMSQDMSAQSSGHATPTVLRDEGPCRDLDAFRSQWPAGALAAIANDNSYFIKYL